MTATDQASPRANRHATQSAVRGSSPPGDSESDTGSAARPPTRAHSLTEPHTLSTEGAATCHYRLTNRFRHVYHSRACLRAPHDRRPPEARTLDPRGGGRLPWRWARAARPGPPPRAARLAAVPAATPLSRSNGFLDGSPRPMQACPHAIRAPHQRLSVRAQASGGGKKISQGEFTEKAWQAPTGWRAASCPRRAWEPSRLLEQTDAYIKQQPRVSGDVGAILGRNLEAVVTKAQEYKKEFEDQYVSIEHLVLGMKDDIRFGQALFRENSLNAVNLTAAIKEIRGTGKVVDQDPEGKYEALSKDGKLDPVIGRDDEIRRAHPDPVAPDQDNNPVLIGEPAWARPRWQRPRAAHRHGDVPAALQGRKLMALDMGSLIAGAKFRGEFEDRLKAIIREVTDSNGRIVLFIDEIHTVVGAGATQVSRGHRLCAG
eukprot:jgi/Tetstr1/457936/TSEL_044454.t1